MNTIAIDFDGVIHRYSQGWKDGTIYDEEVKGWQKCVRELLKEEYSVAIMTTRPGEQVVKWLNEKGFVAEYIPLSEKFWSKKHIIGVTNRKIAANIYIDDRAIQFKGDWSVIKSEIENFKQWNS